jgi:hypothetical protein
MKKIFCSGFSLLEVIVYISIFSLTTLYISSTTYSLLDLLSFHEREVQIELVGITLLHQLHEQHIHHEAALLPDVFQSYTISNKAVAYTPLPNGNIQTTIEFWIKDHAFSFKYVEHD